MLKYFNFAIVASFFGLWIDSFFNTDFQVYLGFSLILSFGIIHGANDIHLINSFKQAKKRYSFYKILTYYIFAVILGALFFYFTPLFALISFVIMSGYHFGEQHWQNLKNFDRWFQFSLQFFYGTSILFMLFYFHQIEVQKIIFEISDLKMDINTIRYFFIIFEIILFLLFTYIYAQEIRLRKQVLLEIFYLFVFAIIFSNSSLIWGFTIYFIVWHSIPSIIDQVKFLYGDLNKINFIFYFKSAILYWIVSLIGLAIFYFIFNNQKLFNSMFFSFLAAITFPHILVMLMMFDKK